MPDNQRKGDGQSNGRMDQASKTIMRFVTVLKGNIETEVRIKSDGKDNVVQWLVRWSCHCSN